MGKLALKTVAELTHVNLEEATAVVRNNPILGDEIHIEEELINLEESMETYRVAAATLNDYPKIKQHLQREKRTILKHCIGLVARMIQGKRLSRPYSRSDTDAALKRLVQLVVGDLHRTGIRIDNRSIETVRPHLGWRQRLSYLGKPSQWARNMLW